MGHLEGEVGMSALKSIENLKRDADHITEISGGSDYAAVRRIIRRHCSQINSEIDLHYVKLPVDKDGLPIHIGERVYTAHGGTYEVARITREDYHVTTTWYIEDFASNNSLGPEDLTHHKPPTVEDVLREFVDEFNRDDSELCDGEIIEFFAKKLRIAEEVAK